MKFGRLILQNGMYKGEQVLDSDLLKQCLSSGEVNDAYGLTFWLNTDAMVYLYRQNGIEIPFPDRRYEIPMAAGAFNQRLYILDDLDMVGARFGRPDNSWSDVEFLARLIDGEAYEAKEKPTNTQLISALLDKQLKTLTDLLSLNSAQQEQIQTLLVTYYDDLSEFREQRAQRSKLQRLRAFRDLRKKRNEMDRAIKQILSAEQAKKYQDLVDKQRSRAREQFNN